MGQLQGIMSGARVQFDENGENGLVLSDKYLPEELLSEILIRVDHKTLLNCQLVCKRWYLILQNYVWRKKAEAIMGIPLHFGADKGCLLYYEICSKKYLETNLIKNHSGKEGRKKHWKILNEGGDGWEVECPPAGAPPLPISDPVFEGKQHCFVSSYYSCSKEQTVDLFTVGLLPQLLDEIQPPIVVSEWYCCRNDCPAIYQCEAKLKDESGEVVDTFTFQDTLQDEKQNTWLHIEHEFTNYGPGVRKVTFHHAGMDQNFWAGHYGSKMAGTCVKVNLPKQESRRRKDSSDLSIDSEHTENENDGDYRSSGEECHIQASTASEERVEFNENDENGLALSEKYLPEELLSEILIRIDYKTLLNCQLVCKRWYLILQNYVWRKKAEAIMKRPLQFNKKMPWMFFYVICTEKSLHKNLIKNHSGKDGKKKHWKIIRNGGHKWKVESFPAGVRDLPRSDPVFEGELHCFVTSFQDCLKEQTVDLVAEGLFPQLLDEFQPPIMISEWYSCRFDCPAVYNCSAKLIDQDGKVLDKFEFEDILVGEKQNTWFHVQHEFVNYGPGLRKVTFCHGGKDGSFWAGHYGSKMAGACVKVNLPRQEAAESNKASDSLVDFE